MIFKKPAPMEKLRSKVIYHGGTLPVPCRLQKGTLCLDGSRLILSAKDPDGRYDIGLSIPRDSIREVASEEKKYYSTTGYFLMLGYADSAGELHRLEIELRCFCRRARGRAALRMWIAALSGSP